MPSFPFTRIKEALVSIPECSSEKLSLTPVLPNTVGPILRLETFGAKVSVQRVNNPLPDIRARMVPPLSCEDTLLKELSSGSNLNRARDSRA